MTARRKELPPLPDHMKRLPVDDRGYVCPWFITWLDRDGEPTRIDSERVTPEFRIMDEQRLVEAVKYNLCWVCGQKLGAYKAFTIGPMCMVNRINAEPPSHLDCAIFSATGCPFLTKPHARRRDNKLPEEVETTGAMLRRQPGVACVWVCKDFGITRAPRFDKDNELAGVGVLFQLGDPISLHWYREGREATRQEILDSIESGRPALEGLAEGPMAEKALEKQIERAMELLPA
jgi:hypothetical protein